MAIAPTNIDTGVSDGITDILGRYTDGDDVNDAIFGDLSGLNVDSDVETVLQTYTVLDTSFWDTQFEADPGEYVADAIKGFTYDLGEAALKAQKDLSLTIATAIKAETSVSISVQQAVAAYLDDLPIQAWVEKASGKIVISETVLSSTTHIPLGTFLAGAGHAVSAFAIYENLKSTIVDSYNALTGQEDTFTPVKDYLIASTTVIAGAVIAAPFAGSGIGLTLLGTGLGAVVGAGAGWATNTAINALPGIVADAKDLSKTLEQTLADAYDAIKGFVNDAWSATGSTAEDVLDYGSGVIGQLYDGFLMPVGDMPPMASPQDLPGWTPGVTVPYGQAEATMTPLVLDIDASGTIELAALNGAGSVYWDIDEDGFGEASGWITGGDGLLAIDLNSDGIINDHGELFGSQTGGSNGFVTLAAYDTNTSGTITSADTQFGDLLVWVDTNADGYSQSSELYTLNNLNITSITTSYSDVSYTIAGNEIKQESTFTMNGNTYDIVDAWFAYDNVNSEYADDYTLDARTLFLPDLRGYGTLPDLHIAMSMDEDLLEMVQEIVTADPEDLFTPAFDLDGKFTDILYQWAGVESDSPTGRGAYFDGQKIGFLETFMGAPYNQPGSNAGPSNPGFGNTINLVTQAWDSAFGSLLIRFLQQTGGAKFLPETTTYNPHTDVLTEEYGEEELAVRFQTTATSNVTGRDLNELYVYRAGEALIASGGSYLNESANQGFDTILLGGISPDDVLIWTESGGHLNIKYTASDQLHVYGDANGATNESLISGRIERVAFDDGTVWDLTQGLALVDSEDNHAVIGSAQGDSIDGRGGADSINGYGGNDVLKGGTGADTISGGAGNDLIYGGAAIDTLYGDTGSDDYIFSVGDGESGYNDLVCETSADVDTDRVVFQGLDAGEVFSWTNSQGHLFIKYSTDDSVQIYGDSSSGSIVGRYFERVVFDDTVWDLTQGLVLQDTDAGHTSIIGSAQNDIIKGNGGEDVINGYAGNDIIYGGDAIDTLYGDTGSDDYIFSVGDGESGYNDVVCETSADVDTDRVVFQGLDAGEVFSWTNSQGHLFIKYSTDDSVQIYGDSSSGSIVGRYFERVVFDDTVWDLTQGLVLQDTNDGHTSIIGSAQNDIIKGNGGEDVINGYAGNDIIYGGDAIDTLYGGTGADTFAFELANAFNNVDAVGDFDISTDNDKVDLSDLLDLYNPLSHAITDFVQITTSGGNSSVFVDRDGTDSTYGFDQVATLYSITGLTDEAALVTSGNLIVV